MDPHLLPRRESLVPGTNTLWPPGKVSSVPAFELLGHPSVTDFYDAHCIVPFVADICISVS